MDDTCEFGAFKAGTCYTDHVSDGETCSASFDPGQLTYEPTEIFGPFYAFNGLCGQLTGGGVSN